MLPLEIWDCILRQCLDHYYNVALVSTQFYRIVGRYKGEAQAQISDFNYTWCCQHGWLEAVQWLHANRGECDTFAMYWAAKYGHLRWHRREFV